MSYEIRTPLNFQFGESNKDWENPSGKSLTVPGMSTPLRTLLDRFVAGREIPIQREPIFEGHLNIPDVRTMDAVDKELYKKQVMAEIQAYRVRLADAQKTKEIESVQALHDRIKQLEAEKTGFSPVVEKNSGPLE